MPEPTNNIFLTTENLAFSLPLIIVCLTYASFKYIPLSIGFPIIAGIGALYAIRFQFQKQREKKLTNLDEDAMRDLVKDIDDDNTADNNKSKVQKAKNKVQARLAQERKQQQSSKKGKTVNADDDDDDDDNNLETFAKSKKK